MKKGRIWCFKCKTLKLDWVSDLYGISLEIDVFLNTKKEINMYLKLVIC